MEHPAHHHFRRSESDFGAPIGDLFGASVPSWLAPLAFSWLWDHRACLNEPIPFITALEHPATRKLDALASGSYPDAVLGHESAYSEVYGLDIVRCLLAGRFGPGAYVDALKALVDDLGLREDFLGWGIGRRAQRVAAPIDWRGPRAVPLLGDSVSSNYGDAESAFGIAMTAPGLVTLYDAIGRSATRPGADSASAAARMCTSEAGRLYDRVLTYAAAFGVGTMVDLPSHGFAEEWGAGSFGAVGYFGSTWVLSKPLQRITVVVNIVGISTMEVEMGSRRPELSRYLLGALQSGVEDRG